MYSISKTRALQQWMIIKYASLILKISPLSKIIQSHIGLLKLKNWR